MTVSVMAGDCREVLKTIADASIDACVTDPPYGLGFMGKKWDQPGALVERQADRTQRWDHVGGNHNPSNSTDQVRTRLSEGRKFQEFNEEWAREIYRVLKPGAHLVAFGGTRTYHRLACAIEDAGFEIRDQIAWMFGTGFPKSHNVANGIDKMHGATNRGHAIASQGWTGWGTALKPAMEPICLARKPLGQGTVAANVLAHGTGALNIDESRIDLDGDYKCAPNGRPSQTGLGDNYDPTVANIGDTRGRWPANVCHDGSDEVLAWFPDSDGAQRGVGPQFGKKASVNCYGDFGPRGTMEPRGDSGSAARFFYSAKATAADRLGSKHPTVKPVALMAWLCRLVTPPGGTILDPFAGTGTTGQAAMRGGFDCILIEREPEYLADIERRLAWARGEGRLTAQEKRRRTAAPDDHGPLFE